jgi:hypothetical protein
MLDGIFAGVLFRVVMRLMLSGELGSGLLGFVRLTDSCRRRLFAGRILGSLARRFLIGQGLAAPHLVALAVAAMAVPAAAAPTAALVDFGLVLALLARFLGEPWRLPP